MKKIWIICTAALLLAAGAALPATAEDQNVAGTWNGTASVRQGKRGFVESEFTLVLKQAGQAVTGTWSQKAGGGGPRGGREVEEIAADGTLAGDKLSLKIGRQRSLEATVSGDSMSGKTAIGNIPAADFKATRAK